MKSPRAYLWSDRFGRLAAVAWLALLVASPALALQPLRAFLDGARASNIDARAAAFSVEQQQAESLAAFGRALPAASVRGVYTRNQYESKIDPSQFAPPGLPTPGTLEPLIIQPFNGLDAYLSLDVPVIDLSSWARVRAANANARTAQHSANATTLDVQRQVARNYYQLVGAQALRVAAQKTLEAAQRNYALSKDRNAGGVATELDVDRAAAEVARAQRNVSDARLTTELTIIALRTLTGITPEGPDGVIQENLRAERPLEQWISVPAEKIPAVASALSQVDTAKASAQASTFEVVPSLNASGQEHFTNATGFTGQNSIWVANATLNWRVDVSTFANMKSGAAAVSVAQTRAEGARLTAMDQIRDAWLRVDNGIAKAEASRVEAQAATAAVARARHRYAAGAGTQLDLLAAERDAFTADVARIQADADLSFARAQLRLSTGHPLDQEEGT